MEYRWFSIKIACGFDIDEYYYYGDFDQALNFAIREILPEYDAANLLTFSIDDYEFFEEMRECFGGMFDDFNK